jgi:hypothetical protein
MPSKPVEQHTVEGLGFLIERVARKHEDMVRWTVEGLGEGKTYLGQG